jgi:hypothetical protein
MTSQDLAELSQNRKKERKKPETEMMKIVIPEHPLLENSI